MYKNLKQSKVIFFSLIILLVSIAVFYVKNNNYIFLYISPDTNTKIFPYISKASREMDKLIFKTAETLTSYMPETKVIYTNGYGSGFLKNNYTASDYDYGAGIYLGKFNYDGKNSKEIAETITKAIALYQANLYSIVQNSDSKFYIQRLTKEKVLGINKEVNEDIKTISVSIDQALKGKPYQMKINNEIFLLNPNEVVLPNYEYIKLYNEDISYYKGYRNILRELTATIDYFIEIKDTRTNKTRFIALISATENGKRLYQSEFKYFVPNAYTNIHSFNYARKIMPEMTDDEYFNTRLINYYHHYSPFKYGNSTRSGSPLKAVKRLLQCTDILAPLLPKEVIEEIHENTYEILKSPTITLLNDYYIANGVLYNVTKAKSFYDELEQNNEVSKLVNNMELILTDMINDYNLTYADLKPLFNYQKELNKNKNNRENFQKIVKEKSWEATKYIEELMKSKMPNYEKFPIYTTYINKVLETGGIYNITFYHNKPEHIYVFKNGMPKHIKLTDINKLDIENGYYTHIFDKNTKFEYMSSDNFYGDTRNLNFGWFRYKPTKLQNAVYEDMKTHMIKDRHRFHLRINAGLIR